MPVSSPAARRAHPLIAGSILAITAAASAQLRVVSYNAAALNGDDQALADVFQALNDDDKPGFALPPHVYVFQEVKNGQQTILLNWIKAAAPPSAYYVLGTYTNQGEDSYSGAQALIYRADTLLEITAEHVDHYTGAGRRTDRWKLQIGGYDSPDASFYIYSSHLKAGDSSGEEQDRLDGVTTIREDADDLPGGTHLIYAGDMNFYHAQEPAYLHFLSPGPGQALDPFGVGSWAGPANAIKHTQSPRSTASGGLVGGGLDDRFDFQLPSAEFHDDAGLALIPGTYRALGNDANHYNTDINYGDNSYYPDDIPRSNDLADLLHVASDHLPLVADYQIPARMSADLPDEFGRIITGAQYELPLTVSNIADVIVTEGADILAFTATGSGVLTGQASDTAAALDDPAVVNLALDTSTPGPLQGSALIQATSQGAQPPSLELHTEGSILRHANPSFLPDADLDQHEITWEVQPDTGLKIKQVPVFNFDYDSLQALLDLDAVDGDTPPFYFVNGLDSGIGSVPAVLTFAFDTDGASGAYEADITITTSDEDLPGQTVALLELTFLITAGEEILGDLNGDGVVDVVDLLELLAQWGDCPPPPAECLGDLDDNAVVDVLDLLILLGNWT